MDESACAKNREKHQTESEGGDRALIAQKALLGRSPAVKKEQGARNRRNVGASSSTRKSNASAATAPSKICAKGIGRRSGDILARMLLATTRAIRTRLTAMASTRLPLTLQT